MQNIVNAYRIFVSLGFVFTLLISVDLSANECRGIFQDNSGLGISWTPYSKKTVPTPEVLRDPYVLEALKSEEFRKFLMDRMSETESIHDYKDLADSRPRYPVEEGPKLPIESTSLSVLQPDQLTHKQLLAYLLENYDLTRKKNVPVYFRADEGPNEHPLYRQLKSLSYLEPYPDSSTFVGEALQSLHQTWETLLREAPKGTRTTLLWVPNKYVVAGGRFTESYFWDSYWIMKGLIESGYKSTALGMLENFIYMIEVYGLPSNGNRFYYLTRTQMPVLMEMVDLMEKNRLLNFDSQTLTLRKRKSLEARVIRATRNYYENIWKGTNRYQPEFGLFKFSDGAGGEGQPDRLVIRPETSIREPRPQETHSQRVYAEFGWDFSYTRCGGSPQNCLPADLNALLAGYTRKLSSLYGKAGHKGLQQHYKIESEQIEKNMTRFLKDAHSGYYLDYRMDQQRLDATVSAAAFFPFFKNLYPNNNQSRQILISLLNRLKPDGHLGIHATDREGPGQWDGSWSWANLNEVAFQALMKYDLVEEADTLALDFSFMVLKTFYRNDRQFFEKFRAEDGDIKIPEHSEIYGNETGFGWTNGTLSVFLKHLVQRDKITSLERRLRNEFPQGVN